MTEKALAGRAGIVTGAGKAMRQKAGERAKIACRDLAAPDPLQLGCGREHFRNLNMSLDQKPLSRVSH